MALMISVAMAAARSAPRSEPANIHDFLPNANPRPCAFGCIVGETNPSIFDQADKTLNAGASNQSEGN
jgi:hypothetical protein